MRAVPGSVPRTVHGIPGSVPGTVPGIPGTVPGTVPGIPGTVPGTVPGTAPEQHLIGKQYIRVIPGTVPGIVPGIPGSVPGTVPGIVPRILRIAPNTIPRLVPESFPDLSEKGLLGSLAQFPEALFEFPISLSKVCEPSHDLEGHISHGLEDSNTHSWNPCIPKCSV